MLNEVLDLLNPQPGFTYLDGTLGLGGHSEALLNKTKGQIDLIGIDRDEKTIEITQTKLSSWNGFKAVHGRFSEIPKLVDKNSLSKPLGGVLLDLGISSFQLNSPVYGLSFAEELFDQPLDMRLDKWCKFSAAEILNNWTEKQIADLFWDYADYKLARKLAKLIVQNRPVNRIGELVELCNLVLNKTDPRISFSRTEGQPHNKFQNKSQNKLSTKLSGQQKSKLNAATLPFMALRMIVNDELGELERGLQNVIDWLEPDCKIVVISFHSGEDRVVKNLFKSACLKSNDFEILTPKPLIPLEAEIKKNPRSRSAKLRALLKKIKSNK